MRLPTPGRRIWLAIHRLERLQVTDQAEIDTVTAAVAQVGADLDATKIALQTELDALHTANPALDLTALNAQVGVVDQAAKDLAGLVPTPPVA